MRIETEKGIIKEEGKKEKKENFTLSLGFGTEILKIGKTTSKNS